MKNRSATMGYFGTEKFDIDLRKDFETWFADGNMVACGQVIQNKQNKPDKNYIACAIMGAWRKYAFSDEKSFMQLVADAKGKLRDEIVEFFNHDELTLIFRMTDNCLKTLTADKVKQIYANLDKGKEFNDAYDAVVVSSENENRKRLKI